MEQLRLSNIPCDKGVSTVQIRVIKTYFIVYNILGEYQKMHALFTSIVGEQEIQKLEKSGRKVAEL